MTLNNRYIPNEKALKMHNVTLQDYLDWCKKVNKPAYENSTKKEFFSRLREGRLIKDSSGQLKRKNRRH